MVSDLQPLVTSWRRHLRAANLSPRTITGYLDDPRLYMGYARRTKLPLRVGSIRRRHLGEFIADQLDRHTASTAATRYKGLQQLFRWLEEEGEIDPSPMNGMRPPRIPEQPVPVLSEEALRALLDACGGREFEDRRDTAIIRVFLDTGARLAEVAGLRSVDDELSNDVDLEAGVLRLMGKGRRERIVRVGNKSIKALDRYLRRRDRHQYAYLDHLWIGKKVRLTPSGIAQMLRRRCRDAGIPVIHPQPVPPHLRPLLARWRRQRRRPHAPRRLEEP
jgi:site-specific recombinase XerC